jgi:hypothetical protein
VFQIRFVPLSACIFFAEKAKKDTASIGARVEVSVLKRNFSWSNYCRRNIENLRFIKSTIKAIRALNSNFSIGRLNKSTIKQLK